MAKSSTIEVEFDGNQNQAVLFRPIQKRLRGRFDATRVNNGGKLMQKWPQPIPGQVLIVSTESGEVSIREPLADDEHQPIRERIEAAGHRIGPAVESCGKVDLATIVYWLRGLIDDGLAKVVSGQLPTKVDGKPRTRFHSAEQPDPATESTDRLCAAIEKQTETLTRLLERMATNALA